MFFALVPLTVELHKKTLFPTLLLVPVVKIRPPAGNQTKSLYNTPFEIVELPAEVGVP